MGQSSPPPATSVFLWESEDPALRSRCLDVLSAAAGRPVSLEETDRIVGLIRDAAPARPPGHAEAWLARLATVCDLGPSDVQEGPAAPVYAEAVRPFVRLLEDQLRREREALFDNDFGGGTQRLLSWYCDRLLSICRYALHVAWASSGKGYRSWVATFTTDPVGTWRALFSEFPALQTLLAAAEEGAREALVEALDRIAIDAPLLFDVFGAQLPVQSLEPGLSDCHRGGRTVMRVRFANGISLILKPKPLDIDRAIHVFAGGGTPHDWGLQPVRVLPREGYGWMEDLGPIRRGRAPSDATGRVAALFWLLNATDLHAENIFGGARGYHALDLETVLSPPFFEMADAPDPSWRAHSLLDTQLVQVSRGDTRRPNISGLFPDQSVAALAPSIRFEVVDDRVELKVAPPDRRSAFEATNWTANADEDIDEITDAFERAVARDRSSLARFVEALPDDLAVRVVLRDTLFYESVLARMHQPRFLRDPFALSLDLLDLFGAQLGDPHLALHPTLARASEELVADEIAQMLAGDIPYSSARAGGRAITLSRSSRPATFSRSGKAWALAKIGGIAPSDIREQATLLQLSLNRWSRPPAVIGAAQSLRSLLAAAAEELAREAFVPVGRPARWMGIVGDANHDELHVTTGQRNLFSGSWGVLLGIEAAAAAASRSPVDCLAREAEAWRHQLSTHAGADATFLAPSLGFEGLGGTALAVSFLARIAPTRWAFLPEALAGHLSRYEPHVREAIARDTSLDVIAGSAGLAIGLDWIMQHQTPDATVWSSVHALHAAAGRHIAGALHDVGDGPGWVTSPAEAPNLGYAHGWAGLVVALAATQRNADRRVLPHALSEAATFPARRLRRDGTFRDYRHDPPGALNRSWCNGLAGLVRGLWDVGEAADLAPDVMGHALERLSARLGSSDVRRFCCGEMGTLDTLLDLAAVEPPVRPLEDTARAILESVLRTKDAPEAWLPSLFQGRSGIVYTAARSVRADLPSLSGQRPAA